jgi:predicted nuclease of predicted toxin-antitoxin system
VRFLVDHDVYSATARFLESLGHDVLRVGQIGCAQASDTELLRVAQKRERIFVARDRDFGGLVFVRGLGAGVIYLWLLPSTLRSAHEELGRVLSSYQEDELGKAFVVVEPGRHRFRRLPE